MIAKQLKKDVRKNAKTTSLADASNEDILRELKARGHCSLVLTAADGEDMMIPIKSFRNPKFVRLIMNELESNLFGTAVVDAIDLAVGQCCNDMKRLVQKRVEELNEVIDPDGKGSVNAGEEMTPKQKKAKSERDDLLSLLKAAQHDRREQEKREREFRKNFRI